MAARVHKEVPVSHLSGAYCPIMPQTRTHIVNPYTVWLTYASGDWLHYNLVMHVCMSLVSSTLLTSRRSHSACCLFDSFFQYIIIRIRQAKL